MDTTRGGEIGPLCVPGQVAIKGCIETLQSRATLSCHTVEQLETCTIYALPPRQKSRVSRSMLEYVAPYRASGAKVRLSYPIGKMSVCDIAVVNRSSVTGVPVSRAESSGSPSIGTDQLPSRSGWGLQCWDGTDGSGSERFWGQRPLCL